jgi:phasin
VRTVASRSPKPEEFPLRGRCAGGGELQLKLKPPQMLRLREIWRMPTKTTAAKPASFPEADAPQAFREMAEKGTTQAKETYEKMSADTTEAADLMNNSYLTAVKGMQDYNNKVIEFAHANINAAFDFVQKMSGMKSPSAFVELWTEHVRKQVETLTEQTKELAALAQKVTLATAEPLKRGVQESVRLS